MTKVNISDIKNELLNFLRNSNVILTSNRGVTSTTETKTGTQVGTETFALTNTNVKNIRSVTVNAVPQTYGTGYTYNLDSGTVTITGSSVGVAVVISLDYGSTDRIFPDFSLLDITNIKFPRVAFDVILGRTDELSLGATTNITQYTIQINTYARTQKEIDTISEAIRQAIQNAKKSFYYFKFITPTGVSSNAISSFGDYKIFQRTQDFEIKFVIET